MIKTIRTDATHPDFIQLVRLLDAYLVEVDGDDNAFYAQFNGIDTIKYVVVAYENDKPVGCGAIKNFNTEAMEVKRMYTSPAHRGKGIATHILTELETWAGELSYKKCILETGKRQHEAVRLYEKNGYQRIPNYGQYAIMENSVCFEKQLIVHSS